MAKIGPLPYKDVLARYPDQVAEIVAKLRRGKSQHRNADPSTLEWVFFWGIIVDPQMVVDYAPIEDQVADRVRRSGVNLQATIGKWWGDSSMIPVPPELVSIHQKAAEDNLARKARVDSMTPEERQAEIDKLVGQLSNKPGFMALYVGPKR